MNPDAYLSIDMLRKSFSIGINKARRLQSYIIKNDLEYAPIGRGVIAPMRVWFKAMQNVK